VAFFNKEMTASQEKLAKLSEKLLAEAKLPPFIQIREGFYYFVQKIKVLQENLKSLEEIDQKRHIIASTQSTIG